MLLIPLLTQIQYEAFNNEQFIYGKKLLVETILLQFATNLFKCYVANKFKDTMQNNLRSKFLKMCLQKFTQISFQKQLLMKTDIERIVQKAYIPIYNFITGLIASVTIFTSMFYIVWLCRLDMYSFIVYVVVISVYFKFRKPLPKREYTKVWKIYEIIGFYNNNLYNDGLNGFSDDTIRNIIKYEKDASDFMFSFNYKKMIEDEKISFIFDIIFLFNIIFLINDMNIVNLLIYIRCATNIKSSVETFLRLKSEYEKGRDEYIAIQEKYLSDDDRENVAQIQINNTLEINNLTHNVSDSFSINLCIPVKFNLGDMILLQGRKGSGKSTFVNAVAGLITPDILELFVDGKACTFINLMSQRFILTQRQDFVNNLSVRHIISSNCEYDDENILKCAIDMACVDFVDITSLDRFMIEFSGGQQMTFLIARAFYQILMHNPKIIILDEIDQQISSEDAVQIFSKIQIYCKENNILCFVIAHTTEVKHMKIFSSVLNFEDGKINLIVDY